MRHTRHYTVEQANATLAWAGSRIERLRDARLTLRSLGGEASGALEALDPQSGGAYPTPELAAPLVSFSLALSELEALDIVVRDVERGLIDFPALRDGDEVYLCWVLGEPEVAFWHGLDAGFAGRQPL
jgi:hypothetical protein